MHEIYLTQALREFLEKTLENFKMETSYFDCDGNVIYESPRVINGYAPPKESRDEKDYSFVVVRPMRGSADIDATEIKVDIIIGCFYPIEDCDGCVVRPYDGHDLCLNVMGRIRTALCELPERTLNRKYQLRLPTEWDLPEEHPYPFWQIVLSTTWLINTPRNIDDF